MGEHRQMDIDHLNLQTASGKIPPSWAPERDRQYPLRLYVADLRLWAASTDVPIDKLGPAAALRLAGGAKSFARELDLQILSQGQLEPDGMGQPVLVPGLQCLIRALERRYAPLEQEMQVFVLSEMLGFRRQGSETIDDALVRFESARNKALQVAAFDMSEIGLAWLALNGLGISKDRWPLLLAPTQGNLPSTDRELRDMFQYLRRQAHLTERGNQDPAKSMQPAYFQLDSDNDRPFTYFGQETAQDPWSSHMWHSAEQETWGLSYDHDPNSVFWTSTDDEDASSCNSNDDEEVLYTEFEGQDMNTVGEQLYLLYRHHKRRWRKFGGHRKGRRKGKGKGKGKHRGFGFGPRKGKGGVFFSDSWDSQYSQHAHEEFEAPGVYFKGSKGSKGPRRSGNPIGRDGQQLKCSHLLIS